MNEAAGRLHVGDLLQVLLVDHLEVAGRRQDQQDPEVEEVLLLELLNASLGGEVVGVALVHEARGGAAVDRVGAQVAELLLDEALPVFVVL